MGIFSYLPFGCILLFIVSTYFDFELIKLPIVLTFYTIKCLPGGELVSKLTDAPEINYK